MARSVIELVLDGELHIWHDRREIRQLHTPALSLPPTIEHQPE